MAEFTLCIILHGQHSGRTHEHKGQYFCAVYHPAHMYQSSVCLWPYNVVSKPDCDRSHEEMPPKSVNTEGQTPCRSRLHEGISGHTKDHKVFHLNKTTWVYYYLFYYCTGYFDILNSGPTANRTDWTGFLFWKRHIWNPGVNGVYTNDFNLVCTMYITQNNGSSLSQAVWNHLILWRTKVRVTITETTVCDIRL